MLSTLPWPTLRRVEVGGHPLRIVDEAHVHPLYGGNKVRKLVGVLAAAEAAGARDLLTFGALGSHHVLATARFGAERGLRTHVVWIRQRPTDHVERQVRRSLPWLASYGLARHGAEVPAATAARAAHVVHAHGAVPFQVPPGGSSVAGTTGWVEAGAWLRATLDDDPWVVVAAGSGGTAAGLWAGGCRVHAVRVAPRALVHRRRLLRLGRQAAEALGVGVPDADRLVLDGDWLAGGYGETDARTEAACAAGRAAGLPVESTYTAKALAAALQLARRHPVVFVQTASASPGHLPLAAELPPALASLLQRS